MAYIERDEDRHAAVVGEPMAWVEDVELVVPAEDVALVGFHEAYHPVAQPLEVAGDVVDNHNPRSDVAVTSDLRATTAPHVVLPTRDRESAPTSAIDIAVRAGQKVYAPVSGEVATVLHYHLYGEHADTRVEIIPDGRPDLRLVMLHVDGVEVVEGDRLVAGETVVARSANGFPFESQIDRFARATTGSAHPHVHVELKRA